MELTFDPYRWLPPPRASGPGDAASTVCPEWPVLAARLAAAHAFQRHALRAGRSAPTVRRVVDTMAEAGSFHAGTARVLSGFLPVSGVVPYGVAGTISDEGSRLADVNPTSSADRKGPSGKVSTVAGPPYSGNRGLK
ncbi:MAG: hypothetical protein KGJ57_11525 [Sphingomonadales bacterium]|nr:hypothetical protein [Sphingomonadales bacterium]MDE2170045.1 hypothetical protein [Sphingomonadales bacterium]